jgi:hypothetical protein
MAVFIVRESVMAVDEKVCTHCTPGNSAATLFSLLKDGGKERRVGVRAKGEGGCNGQRTEWEECKLGR